MTDKVETTAEVKPTAAAPKGSGSGWLDKIKSKLGNVIIQVVTVDSPPKVDPRREYPKTVAECIDDDLKYRKGTGTAIQKFRDSQPWRGTVEEIQYKFRLLNAELAKIYEIEAPNLVFCKEFPVGPCCFPTAVPAVIVMEELRTSPGTYSVVAYLHEFGHAIGKDEKGTCRWSLNLFKRYFPKAYEALEPRGHLLFKKEAKNPEKAATLEKAREDRGNAS